MTVFRKNYNVNDLVNTHVVSDGQVGNSGCSKLITFGELVAHIESSETSFYKLIVRRCELRNFLEMKNELLKRIGVSKNRDEIFPFTWCCRVIFRKQNGWGYFAMSNKVNK